MADLPLRGRVGELDHVVGHALGVAAPILGRECRVVAVEAQLVLTSSPPTGCEQPVDDVHAVGHLGRSSGARAGCSPSRRREKPIGVGFVPRMEAEGKRHAGSLPCGRLASPSILVLDRRSSRFSPSWSRGGRASRSTVSRSCWKPGLAPWATTPALAYTDAVGGRVETSCALRSQGRAGGRAPRPIGATNPLEPPAPCGQNSSSSEIDLPASSVRNLRLISGADRLPTGLRTPVPKGQVYFIYHRQCQTDTPRPTPAIPTPRSQSN